MDRPRLELTGVVLDSPARPGDPRMKLHLDVRVDDLDAAGEFARSLGAELAPSPPQDDVRVHLDPAGHPFCLHL